jgi:hypothetical protein
VEPASVVSVGDLGVTVALEGGGRVVAELALTFPYEPAVGDELLVIGEAGEHFAIGVLGAAAPSALALGEEGELHAGGVLTVSSEASLHVEAPRVSVRGRALRTFASRLSETAERADTWVRGLLTQRAGEARRVVEGADATCARRSVTLARQKVKIDGGVLDMGH